MNKARSWLLKPLYPKVWVRTYQEVDLDDLKRRGLKGIITDLDNTLLPRRSSIMPPEVFQWLNKARQMGFQIFVVSNNFKSRRVREQSEKLRLPYIGKAYKPFGFGLRRAARRMGLKPKEIALMGDQLVTDILGGNRLGMHTILVDAMEQSGLWYRFVVQAFDQWLIKTLLKKEHFQCHPRESGDPS